MAEQPYRPDRRDKSKPTGTNRFGLSGDEALDFIAIDGKPLRQEVEEREAKRAGRKQGPSPEK